MQQHRHPRVARSRYLPPHRRELKAKSKPLSYDPKTTRPAEPEGSPPRARGSLRPPEPEQPPQERLYKDGPWSRQRPKGGPRRRPLTLLRSGGQRPRRQRSRSPRPRSTSQRRLRRGTRPTASQSAFGRDAPVSCEQARRPAKGPRQYDS